MIILVVVCIATATVFAWLALELGRFALGDLRVPRLAIGLPRPFAPKPINSAPGPQEAAAPAPEDVEQRVRDRLYGERNGALRRDRTTTE